MAIKTKGLIHLDTGYYDKISISEKDTGEYRIDVNGLSTVNTVVSDVNLFIKHKNISDEDKIIALVNRFLNEYKINGITDMMKLPRSNGEWVVIYGQFDYKFLRLQLYDSKFDVITQMSFNKYIQDRYNYCWNEDIRTMKIKLSPNVSKYDVRSSSCDECEFNCNEDTNCNTYNEFTLKTSKDGRVLEFERKFIEEFLNYKFWQIGEEVTVTGIYYESPDSFTRRFKGHIIKCGDFKLTFSHCDSLMFIFGIVNNYNNELFMIKENVKRKQLKMDGF